MSPKPTRFTFPNSCPVTFPNSCPVTSLNSCPFPTWNLWDLVAAILGIPKAPNSSRIPLLWGFFGIFLPVLTHPSHLSLSRELYPAPKFHLFHQQAEKPQNIPQFIKPNIKNIGIFLPFSLLSRQIFGVIPWRTFQLIPAPLPGRAPGISNTSSSAFPCGERRE